MFKSCLRHAVVEVPDCQASSPQKAQCQNPHAPFCFCSVDQHNSCSVNVHRVYGQTKPRHWGYGEPKPTLIFSKRWPYWHWEGFVVCKYNKASLLSEQL